MRAAQVGRVVAPGIVALCLLCAGVLPPGAVAASPAAPAWSLAVLSQPTSFQASGEDDEYELLLTNVGALSSSGDVIVVDTLPAGVTTAAPARGGGTESGEWECGASVGASTVSCRFSHPVAALTQAPAIVVPVAVAKGVEGALLDEAHVVGGGAAEASARTQTQFGASALPFGVSSFAASLAGPGGTPDMQAGLAPSGLTIRVDLNSVVREDPEGKLEPTSVHDVKDMMLDLPLGLLGSALATPTCTFAQLGSLQGCPPDTRIGSIVTEPSGSASVDGPLYNVVPERGVAAEFGFADGLDNTHVLDASIAPSASGYVLQLAIRELTQIGLTDFAASIYGDPASIDESGGSPPVLLTNPSSCAGQPLAISLHLDSWQQPGAFNPDGTPDLSAPYWVSASAEVPAASGCGALASLFAPTIASRVEATRADTPTGIQLDVNVPQQDGVEPLATSPLKDLQIALPDGISIDPSAANGLKGCSLPQLGMSASGVPDAAQPTCPEESRVGTVEVETPALASEVCKQGVGDPVFASLSECPQESEREEVPLVGSIYLANPSENPFGSLLALYIVIDDPRTGVLVKLPAEVKANDVTGQLTIALEGLPELRISELRAHFFGGNTALLRTPSDCGSYTVSSQLTPWSAPESGPAATSSSAFQITQGAGGSACRSPMPFAPTLTAGSSSSAAGASSPFTVQVARQDTEQPLSDVSVTTPPGLLAELASVSPCPEAQAQRGACAQTSRIGSAVLAAGAGPAPLWLGAAGSAPDPIYVTAPYQGAPFGLAIVVAANVGPFDLGDGSPVVIRARVGVNPQSAQLQIVTDPLPQILAGIPLGLRTFSMTIDRSGLVLNPTSCSPMSVDAVLTGAEGATADASSHFQAANCLALKFAPKLTALTRANGEFAGHGASLRLELSTSAGQANMRALKIDLPQRLPARLQTIQKACSADVFEADPASCPKAAIIGSASLATPMLGVPLVGPAYLVAKRGKLSKGASGFPNIVLALHGNGVSIDLSGEVYVSEKNVTSVIFRSLPDVPIRLMDLTLPEGADSILAAGERLCTKKPLRITTAITAQDGVRTKPVVNVAVEGCRRVRRAKRSRATA
jgi:hypothetical protein